MAPKAKPPSSELHVSLRFKYGIHTVHLLVSPLSPFSEITDELLACLRERYPSGLSSSMSASSDTPIPTDAELQNDEVEVRYAVSAATKNQTVEEAGWKDLNVKGGETPTQKGVRDGTDVAFVFWRDEERPEFVVEWPVLDDEGEEEEGEDPGVADLDDDEDLEIPDLGSRVR